MTAMIMNAMADADGDTMAHLAEVLLGLNLEFNEELEVYEEVDDSTSTDFEPISDPNLMELIRKGM